MRNMTMLSAAALASVIVSGSAAARPASTIDCPLQAMSAQQRTKIAVSLVQDEQGGEAVDAARAFIGPLAETCGKANKWSFDRSQSTVSWTMWSLMSDELQKEAGISPADAAILRTYFDQHAKQLEGMVGFTAAQRSQLIGELRKLGAHLHDDGSKVSEQELTIILLAQQMRQQEAQFAAP